MAVPESDPWSDVIGQSEAVDGLSVAVGSPVHAYLFVGPRGSQKRVAASVFAGELLVAADSRATAEPQRAARHRRLAVAEQHPDIYVLSPAGNALRREDEVAQLIVEANRTPMEGNRKVLIVDRFHTATAAAAAALLKPVEEPDGAIVWLLLAEQVLPEHVTIASRCTRVRFGPVPDKTIEATLVAEGLAKPERAQLLAGAAGGNLHRARVLAGDEQVMTRRDAWWSVPDRLDGTGATVWVLVDEVRELITEAGKFLEQRHRVEAEAQDQREEQLGARGSGRSVLEARQRRELRQFRTDEIRFGLATLAARYREQVVSSAHRDDGSGDLPGVQALRRLHATAESLTRSPNEALALQALLLDLPAVHQTHPPSA